MFRPHHTWFKYLLYSEKTIATPILLWHGFPLPINENMKKILLHYDVSSVQLPSSIVLVYERLILLKKTFSKKFSMRRLLLSWRFLKVRGATILSLTEHGLCIRGEPLMNNLWLDNPHVVIGNWKSRGSCVLCNYRSEYNYCISFPIYFCLQIFVFLLLISTTICFLQRMPNWSQSPSRLRRIV